MKKKLFASFIMMFLTLCLVGVFSCTSVAKAAPGLDGLNEGSNQQQQQNDGTGDEAMDSITDYMEGHNAVTNESMQKADKMVSPISSLIGTLVGVVILLTDALVFLVTAVDLMYIAIPFTRSFLGPDPSAGGGAAGGMGMGGGMMGHRMGMMGGGMGGGGMAPQRQFVSDEAVKALQMTGAGGGGQMGSPMGGMGMGMGMGMMGAGGMQQQQQGGGKSAILQYLKSRVFFLIVFGVATTILMSSIFLDCGLNLAKLLYKIMAMLNGGLSDVNI